MAHLDAVRHSVNLEEDVMIVDALGTWMPSRPARALAASIDPAAPLIRTEASQYVHRLLSMCYDYMYYEQLLIHIGVNYFLIYVVYPANE